MQSGNNLSKYFLGSGSWRVVAIMLRSCLIAIILSDCIAKYNANGNIRVFMFMGVCSSIIV